MLGLCAVLKVLKNHSQILTLIIKIIEQSEDFLEFNP